MCTARLGCLYTRRVRAHEAVGYEETDRVVFYAMGPDGVMRFWGLPIVVSNLFPTSTSTINDTPMLYVGDMSKAVHLACGAISRCSGATSG